MAYEERLQLRFRKKIEDKDYQNSEKIRDSSIFRENLGDKNYRNSENDKGCL